MADPFKNFTLKSTLRRISSEGIFSICDYIKVGFSEEYAALKESIRRAPLLEAAESHLRQTPEIELEAQKLLRIGYFFYQQRRSVPGLVEYVCAHSGMEPDQEMLDACKSEAEQAIRLMMDYSEPVREFYAITLHTQPTKRYWQRRDDYCAEGFANILSKIDDLPLAIQNYFTAQGRGNGYRLRKFDHAGKHYLFIDLPDTPTDMKEWQNEDVLERSVKPVMEVVIVLDEASKSVDVMAEDAVTRRAIHQECAATLFNRTIETRPRNNETYDMDALFQQVVNNTPLSVVSPQNHTVEKIFVSKLRIVQQSFPYHEITLNLRIGKKQAIDHNEDCAMHQLLRSIVWLDSKNQRPWRIDNITTNHAELIAVYWDDIEGKLVSKSFTLNSQGGSSLHHSEEDEVIKNYLRGAGILKTTEAEGVVVSAKATA